MKPKVVEVYSANKPTRAERQALVNEYLNKLGARNVRVTSVTRRGGRGSWVLRLEYDQAEVAQS